MLVETSFFYIFHSPLCVPDLNCHCAGYFSFTLITFYAAEYMQYGMC